MSTPDLNITLTPPKEIDAKKLANKSILGKKVLNASQRSQVMQGGEDIKTAQKDVKNAQCDINEAKDDVTRGIGDQNNANDQAGAAQASADSMSAEELDAETELLAQGAEVAKAHTATLDETLETLGEEQEDYDKNTAAIMDEVNTSTEEANDVATQQEDVAARITALGEKAVSAAKEAEAQAPTAAPADPTSDGMGGVVDAAFDGTGSGVKSAYSLSTASDVDGSNNQPAPTADGPRRAPKTRASQAPVQPQQAAPEQQAPQSQAPQANGDAAANVEEITTELEGLKTEMDGLTQRQQSIQDIVSASLVDVDAQSDEKSEALAAQQEGANAVVEEGNAQNEGLAKTAETFQTAAQVGQYTSMAGQATTMTGVALSATGAGLTTGGTTMQGVGAGIKGIGLAISSIGAPLCSLFGIGSPIVAAGGTTTASGVTTFAAGGTLSATGTTLTTAGTTTQEVGLTVQKVGTGISLASNAGLTGVAVAQGDWAGAISGGLNVAAGALSFADSVGVTKGLSEAAKKGLDTAGKVASAASATFDTTVAAIEGNTMGIISGGLSMASSAGDFAGNGQAAKLVKSGANFAKQSLGMYQSVESGEGVVGLVGQGLALASSASALLEDAGVNTGTFATKEKTLSTHTVTEYETNKDGTYKLNENGEKIAKTDKNGNVMTHQEVDRDSNGKKIYTTTTAKDKNSNDKKTSQVISDGAKVYTQVTGIMEQTGIIKSGSNSGNNEENSEDTTTNTASNDSQTSDASILHYNEVKLQRNYKVPKRH